MQIEKPIFKEGKSLYWLLFYYWSLKIVAHCWFFLGSPLYRSTRIQRSNKEREGKEIWHIVPMYTACRLGSRILFSTIREVVATHTAHAYTIVVLVATSFFLTRLRNRKKKKGPKCTSCCSSSCRLFPPFSLFFLSQLLVLPWVYARFSIEMHFQHWL